MSQNRSPQQLARDHIDAALILSGWGIQDKTKINLNAALGVAVREYQTDIGPPDYILFVEKCPVGIIEAKRQEEGVMFSYTQSFFTPYLTSSVYPLQ